MKRILAWVGATAGCLLCVACGGNLPQPHAWTESRSDRNNSGFNAIRTIDATATSKKWSVGVGALAFSTPVEGPDGTIYIGNTAGEAVGVNPNGTIRFRYQLGSVILAPPAVDPVSGDVIFIVQNPLTPSEYGSFLYRLSANGTTMTVSTENFDTTGAPKIWRDYVFVVNRAFIYVFDRVGLELVAKAYLYTRNCDALICAGSDPFSFIWTAGEIIWCMARGWPVSDCGPFLEDGPVHDASVAVLDGASFTGDPNQPLLVTTNGHCANAWRFIPTAAPNERLVYAWDQEFVSVDCGSERVRPTSPAVIVDGQAVFGDQSGRVISLDPRTGQQLWKRELEGAAKEAPVAFLRQIYIPFTSKLVVLDSDGATISENALRGWGSIAALSLDRVYMVTSEGIHTFSLDTQSTSFDALSTDVSPGKAVQAGLAIGKDGTIYVSTPSGFLHAYGPR